MNNPEFSEMYDQRTANLTLDQLKIIDSKSGISGRSDLITAIIVSYIKKLKTIKGIKICCSVSEFIRNAITDWILYDFNAETNYPDTLRNWLNQINGKVKREQGIKINNKTFNPNQPKGIVPKIILPIFKNAFYTNRLVSHLAENLDSFLTFKELSEKIGCSTFMVIIEVRRANKQYPNLIIRRKEDKEFTKFGINSAVLNEVLNK